MSRRGRVVLRWAGLCLAAVIVTVTQATPAGAKSHGEAKVSPPLLALAESRPEDEFSVIVGARAKQGKAEQAERAAAATRRANGKVGRGLSIVGGASARLTGAEILELARDTEVEYIASDDVLTAFFDPTEGAALAASPGILEVGAPSVWRQLGITGRGVGVAILDSGIAPHPDLAGRIVASVDFTGGTGGSLVAPADPGGHGTHVAGLVAGDGAASGGAYAGVAPGTNLVDVRVIGSSGTANASTVIAGMQWILAHRSDYNIRVVNISAGAPVTYSYRYDPLATAVEVLVFAGITVVVSAGNDGPKRSSITRPGNDPFVITVGAIDDRATATTADDSLASWSSRGPTRIDGIAKPDVVAPGRQIVGLRSPGSTLDLERQNRLVAGLDPLEPAYFRLSGTSMAAAVVSGVVALMLEARPDLTPGQVKHRLMSSATVLSFGSPTSTGRGLVNAVAAIGATDVSPTPPPAPVSYWFARELYTAITGQPLRWRDLTSNGGMDSAGTPWTLVSWANIVWDATTWQNIDWAAFDWSGVSMQDISWEDISWEDISWETVNKLKNGREGTGSKVGDGWRELGW